MRSNRLKTANGASYGNFGYNYDQTGNMTGKESVTQNYGAVNFRPHAVTSTSAGLSLAYDADGNMISKSSPSRPAQTLTYDAENRLVQVDGPVPYRKLDPGWNFVSFPQIVGEVPVATAITNFSGNCEQLTRYNTRSNWFESFVNLPGTNQFNTVNATNGYAIFVTNVAGLYLPLGTTPAATGRRLLPAGTNFLAGPSDIMAATNWLAGLVRGLDYDQVTGLDPNTGSTVSATTVRPGEAYYVRMLLSATWTPPATAHITNPTTVRYVYDGDGGRVKKITWKGTTLFLGQSFEISPDGQTTTYVFAGGMRIAARESTGAFRIYLSDHLGSSNVITDQTGTSVEVTENTPYGSISRNDGPVNVAHRFTGQRLDDETGLYFYNARYYDPEVGRFTSPDSFIQTASDPQTLNRYSYVRDNPLTFTDPSGHFFFAFIIPFIIGAFTGAALGAGFAAISGGDIGRGALFGAISGFFASGFSAIANSVASGTSFAANLGRAAINAVGNGIGNTVNAAISGGNIGRAALQGFEFSFAASAANYAIGQWSGYSKDVASVRTSYGTEQQLPLGSNVIGVQGIGGGDEAADAALFKYKNIDAILVNPSHGPIADIVESTQELLFGPGSWSHSAAKLLDAAAVSGGSYSFVAHSQGGIQFGQALGLMNESFKSSGSTVTFVKTPYGRLASYTSGWSAGLHVKYEDHAFDIVSALGNPWLLPSAVVSLPIYAASGALAHTVNVWDNRAPPLPR